MVQRWLIALNESWSQPWYRELARVLHREELQSIVVVQTARPQARAQRQIVHRIDLMHLAGLPGTLNEELLQSILLLDLPGTPSRELLQSILPLEVACWIQKFDGKNLGHLLLFASKHTMTEHRM